VILIGTGTALAQAPAPALVTSDAAGQSAHLRLSKVEVDVRLLGTLAETTMTMVFANPEARQREGDLYFPLPQGAVVCGYAMDVLGKMVDGVMIESDYARQTYESFVNRSKDPALLELVRGNTLRARVFPIPSSGTRTIAVRYVTDLSTEGDALRYRLPLAFKEKLDQFRVRIEAARTESEPKVVSAGPVHLAFYKTPGGFLAENTLKDVSMTDPLVVALSGQEAPRIMVEKASDGKVYFCIKLAPPPAEAATTPKRVTILWDGSGSRAAVDHSRELKALAAWLGQFQKAEIAVDLVVFRNVAEPARRFLVKGGRCEALMAALAAIEYDGGTRLKILTPPENPMAPENSAAIIRAPAPEGSAATEGPPIVAFAKAEPPDLYLLFTDGIATLGTERTEYSSGEYTWHGESFPSGRQPALSKDRPAALGAPVYAFVTGKDRNMAALEDLVERTGGLVIDLDRLSQEQALFQAGLAWLRVRPVEVTAGKVADLLPASEKCITGGVIVVGRLESDEATVKVTTGRTSRDLAAKEFKISAKEAASGPLVRFVWASHKLAELQDIARSYELQNARTLNESNELWARTEANRAEIIRLSKECSVMTSYTSLIVLETLEQHIQFGIRPPDMLPAMQKAYDAELARRLKAAPAPGQRTLFGVQPGVPYQPSKYHHDPTQDKLYNVLIPWYYRIALWEDVPEVPPDFKYKPTGPDPAASTGAGGSLKGPSGGYGPSLFGPYPGETRAGGPAGNQFASQLVVVAEAEVGGLFGSGASVGGGVGGGGGGGTGGVFGVSAAVGGGPSPSGNIPMIVPTSVQDVVATPPTFGKPAPTATPNQAATGTEATPVARPTPTTAPTTAEPPAGNPIVVPVKKVEDFSYRKTMAAAPPEKLWAIYMAERPKHVDSPRFFIDCTVFFLDRNQETRAVQVMSNLAEYEFTDSLRWMAMRLIMRHRLDLAAEALAMEGDSNVYNLLNTYDLAAILERQGKLVEAAKLLLDVGSSDFGWQNPGIQITALADLNRLIPKIGPDAVKKLGISRRLIKRMDADLRVVITWDENVDVDLAVTEPSGETCYYDHASTTIGGFLWSDVQAGGPEEYLLRKAMPGVYKIAVSLAEPDVPAGAVAPASVIPAESRDKRPPDAPQETGSDNELPVLVRVEVYTDFCRAGEKREDFMIQLRKPGESVTVKELELPRGPPAAAGPGGTH
jgi:hypothetical protein